jgi:uncharacterized integral membrane protein
MALGYFMVAILTAAVVVFAFQNEMSVAVRFLSWTLPATSLAGLVLAALTVGIVVAGVPLWIQRWRLRARVRTLEVQVRQLETSLAERDRALLGRPPSPGLR